MKASELSEAPYVQDGPHYVRLPDTHSDKFIRMNYKKITETQSDINPITIYLHNEHIKVIGTTPDGTPDHPNRIVFELKFHSTPTIKIPHDIKNPLQVSSVYLSAELRGSGVASKAYKALVDNGFTVLSDSTQTSSGQALWQRLIANGFKIYVIDEDDGVVCDKNGCPILFDGSNIKNVWTYDNDYSGFHKILKLI